jgi:hypothetical protein
MGRIPRNISDRALKDPRFSEERWRPVLEGPGVGVCDGMAPGREAVRAASAGLVAQGPVRSGSPVRGPQACRPAGRQVDKPQTTPSPRSPPRAISSIALIFAVSGDHPSRAGNESRGFTHFVRYWRRQVALSLPSSIISPPASSRLSCRGYRSSFRRGKAAPVTKCRHHP